MVVATLLGRHEAVRASAAWLGFVLDGEGPIDAPLGPCLVRLRDARGWSAVYPALRRGPVTACIVGMSGPGSAEVHRDLVLIDPVAVDPGTPADGDAEACPPEFRGVEVLTSGGYRSYGLDGRHPGEDAVARLEEALASIGAAFLQQSNDEYALLIEGEGEGEGEGDRDGMEVPALYAFIAAPATVSTAVLHACVREQIRDWPPPVTYCRLLEEVGLVDELAEHRRLADELGLDS
jgi:hypothetical protein